MSYHRLLDIVARLKTLQEDTERLIKDVEQLHKDIDKVPQSLYLDRVVDKRERRDLYAVGQLHASGYEYGPFPSIQQALKIDGMANGRIFLINGHDYTPIPLFQWNLMLQRWEVCYAD